MINEIFNGRKVKMLGIIAAICTTGAFIPQAYRVFKTNDTKSISLLMYIMTTMGVALWFFHGMNIQDTPVMVANGCTFILSLCILYMKVANIVKKID